MDVTPAMESAAPGFVRPYAPADRAAVRRICCATGFMGEPVDRLFSDREAFADFFTRYYTDWEPEHASVAVADGAVVGYLLGCLAYGRYPRVQARIVAARAPRMLARLLGGRYARQDFRFLAWFLFRAAGETPRIPRHAAHFHINLLPAWRNGSLARRLIFPFLESLPRRGVRRVYGQIQTYADRRPIKIFERYGFQLLDQRPVTKFERFGVTGVFVSTVCREFSPQELAAGGK